MAANHTKANTRLMEMLRPLADRAGLDVAAKAKHGGYEITRRVDGRVLFTGYWKHAQVFIAGYVSACERPRT
jgi:hypothetical protein